jgi:phosphoribosylamine--glycine ligase
VCHRARRQRASAQKRAYELVDQIHFDGMQYRRDIGYRAIGRKR